MVLGTLMLPPFSAGMETALFAMGRFWGRASLLAGAGRVHDGGGYAGGKQSNPTDEQVSAGTNGHAHVVRVVFDPQQTTFAELVRLFCEGHHPTQGMRQGDDEGTQYRSMMYYGPASQRHAAEASRDLYQSAWTAAGRGTISTEIAAAPECYCASADQQPYLARKPGG